jgi:hypothetical protein
VNGQLDHEYEEMDSFQLGPDHDTDADRVWQADPSGRVCCQMHEMAYRTRDARAMVIADATAQGIQLSARARLWEQAARIGKVLF